MKPSTELPKRARRERRWYRAGIALCASLAYATQAAAQADVNPQTPNLLLLVDTSGSMEYKTSSNVFPICRYDTTGVAPSAPATSERSRWTDLVEVLTGSITNYQCQTLDRGSASFKNEYKITGSTLGARSPYDFLYANPYHRPLSGTCAPGPGTLSLTNPADFLVNSFNYHVYNDTASSCSFDQSPDGILDAFKEDVRFALMTFDTDPSADQGELGSYSYVVGAPHSGMPLNCTTPSVMEVGARNAFAPPWEGRLIPFGNPQPGTLDYQAKNDQIQKVLRASRPYGATPIAGMLSDARDFLRKDISADPVDPSQNFGPSQDPYASCRKTRVLLLSDGQPNMDLRGHCAGNNCPFDLPEDIASDLLHPLTGQQAIKTFVVGFALNSLQVGTQTIDCAALDATNLDATCTAHPENASLQACCNLARIAIAGDTDPTRHAFFANDREALRRDISTVLSEALPATSRTQAAFSGTAGTNTAAAFAASYRFFSDFSPVLLQPWSGRITRERWICNDAHQPVRVVPDPTVGDSFADNLNTTSISGTGPGRARTFYTVQPANGGAFPDRTLRPSLAGIDPDGMGTLTGSVSSGQATTFVANTTPTSMGLTDTSCTTTVGTVVTSQTASQCRDKYMKWLVGLDNGTIFSRCPKGSCNLLGDIFHATPRIVNAPQDLTADDTFQTFQKTYATRPLMLYASSNDGLLHAFKVASNLPGDQEQIDSKKNNELWAFIPPEVLPHIAAQYPYTHQMLLDGVSVTKDVVARKVGTNYVLERSVSDSSALGNATWRTILVQSFGSVYPGYFALDVTNPDPLMTIDSQTGGPRFLWQITSDANGTPLFGTGGATPIITTVAIDEFGTGDTREVAVAILPGGSAGAGGAGTGGGCARATPSSVLGSGKFGSYPPRGFVPCYTSDLGARSLTVVRLDTGKIIRTFRRNKTELPAAIQSSVNEAPLDSPITGEPVAFPTDVGSVAERIFVGDQDGTLWKADVSNKLPAQWTMSLFWDAFPNVSIHSKGAGTWNGGQPIATAPLLSVDPNNNLTIAISTGSQGNLGAATGMLNYVWSLRDLPDANKVFSPDLLWVEQLLDGERVTGPISLFNSYLYFSTVTPPAANTACKSTNGARVWGMHYLTPLGGEGTSVAAAVRDVGGLAAPFIKANFNSTNQFVTDLELLGTAAKDQAVIYGVTVAQVPTCFSTDVAGDALGGTKISNVNPGKFQLLVQTGAASLGAGGQAEAAAPPGAVTVTLPSLATPARVEAWAALVE